MSVRIRRRHSRLAVNHTPLAVLLALVLDRRRSAVMESQAASHKKVREEDDDKAGWAGARAKYIKGEGRASPSHHFASIETKATSCAVINHLGSQQLIFVLLIRNGLGQPSSTQQVPFIIHQNTTTTASSGREPIHNIDLT